MTWFVTRVELHDARHGEKVYEDLHSYMETLGFMKTIRSDDGIWYHLPPAEYWFVEGNQSFEQIRSLAKIAADATGYTNSILVSEISRACWVGLKPV